MQPIKNYENYLITENGLVFNTKLNKYLKIQTNRYGYKVVQLYKNGIPKRFSIHRLIAIQYIKNSFNKLEVNHINGIKSDNRLENLEWVTKSENGLHSYKMGLSNISELNKKMVRAKVTKVVLDTKSGIFYDSLTDLCNELNLKYSKMRDMLSNRTKNKSKFIYA
jgi:hypothetical protein